MYEGIAEEGTFHTVGLDYGGGKKRVAEDEELVMVDQPELPEYLPTSCVDFLDEGAQPYTPPEELDLPEGLITVSAIFGEVEVMFFRVVCVCVCVCVCGCSP